MLWESGRVNPTFRAHFFSFFKRSALLFSFIFCIMTGSIEMFSYSNSYWIRNNQFGEKCMIVGSFSWKLCYLSLGESILGCSVEPKYLSNLHVAEFSWISNQARGKLRCWGGKTAIRIVQYDPEHEPKNCGITQNRVFEDLEWAWVTLSEFAQGNARIDRHFCARKSAFWEIWQFFTLTSEVFLTIGLLRFTP